MTHAKLKKKLSSLGLNMTDAQVWQIIELLKSGKMDFHTVKKLLLPALPDHLMETSLEVISKIEINLQTDARLPHKR